MNIKKVDDKPMVIHTKEKPKLKIKGAPETKIKGRNVLTVRHEPKIAGSSTEKSVVENGRIKLKKSPVHVADKRKTGQTTTAVDGMEYKGRNGTVQDRKAGRTAYEQGRSGSGNVQDRKGNATVQDRAHTVQYRAEKKVWLYRTGSMAEQHKAQMQIQTHGADGEKSRKSGSP